MRYLIAAATIALLSVPAHADTMANCSAARKGMTPDQQKVMTYQDWSKKCLAKDYTVPANESAIPAGATGECKDGTYTMSKTHSGACSHRGGVKRWL